MLWKGFYCSSPTHDVDEGEAVVLRRWNGATERQKLNTQRQAHVSQKTSNREAHLAQYSELQTERSTGVAANKDSLARQKHIEEELAEARKSKAPELIKQIACLRQQQENEKELRRAWAIRQKEIDAEIQSLKDGELSGVRLNGRRKAQRPPSSTTSQLAPTTIAHVDAHRGGNNLIFE
ncbi:hypothetical protein BDN67DRAFT_587075 [Paxillus ammoniavirescens]|nr:hypothetical protein BDN67DRAFT_587075 [Paxillus ammoniavirescens]